MLPLFNALNRWIRPLHLANQIERAAVDLSEEDSLAAYSADGSYGRRAIELLDLVGHESTDIVGVGTFGANSQHYPSGQHKSGWLNQTQPSGAHSSSSSAPSGELFGRHFLYNNNLVNSKPRPNKTPKRHLDSSSIYRDQVYRFDGSKSVVVVPNSLIQQFRKITTNKSSDGYIFGARNTISFWMRHAKSSESKDNGPKTLLGGEHLEHNDEHLLCATERIGGQNSSVRINFRLAIDPSCRLVLQLVQNQSADYREYRHGPAESRPSTNSDHVVFFPSEWRWKLNRNEACDNRWHLYTLNVNYPKAELYIDGEQFEETHENPAIKVSEPATKRHFTGGSNFTASQNQQTLVLGGCWNGNSKEPIDESDDLMFGQFKGQLSGLSVLTHENDDSKTIECLGHCSESLVWKPTSDSSSAVQHDQQFRPQKGPKSSHSKAHKLDNSFISYQESQSKIRLLGHDFIDIEEALSQIAYVNKRQLPSIGRRDIVIEATIDCANQLSHDTSQNQTPTAKMHSVQIEPVRIQVQVLPSLSLPKIVISGSSNLALDNGKFIVGFQMFANILIGIKRVPLGAPTNDRISPENHDLSKTNRSNEMHLPSTISGGSLKHGNTLDIDYVEDSENLIQDNQQHSKVWSRSTGNEHKSSNNNSRGFSWHRIEACSMRTFPPIKSQNEEIVLPNKQLDELKLYWRLSQDGFVIYGLDSVQNYQHILRSIVYKNLEPVGYFERHFRLICSDMNGRLVSNEYHLTLSSIQAKTSTSKQTNQTNELPPKDTIQQAQSKSEYYKPTAKYSSFKIDNQAIAWQQAGLEYRDEPADGRYVSTSMDRIAMAFLVFVISLVVIMLLITLTNLNEPNLHTSDEDRKLDEQVPSILYYDVDSNGQKGSQVGCFLHPIPGLTDDEDDSERATSGFQTDPKSRMRPPFMSNTNYDDFFDQESLMWDDEQVASSDERENYLVSMIYNSDYESDSDVCPLTNIVVNPSFDETPRQSCEDDARNHSMRPQRGPAESSSGCRLVAECEHDCIERQADCGHNRDIDDCFDDTQSSCSSIDCSAIVELTSDSDGDDECRYFRCRDSHTDKSDGSDD